MANTVQLTKNGQPVFPVTDESLVTGLNYRPYDSQNPNGMGYIVLKKNKTFAEQVTEENTIYEIRYDFDLGGASVTIPEGCVLKFEGGSLSNGTIVGNDTDIISGARLIFHDDLSATGLRCDGKVEWVGNDFNRALSLFGSISLVHNKTYTIDTPVIFPFNAAIDGNNAMINVNMVADAHVFVLGYGSKVANLNVKSPTLVNVFYVATENLQASYDARDFYNLNCGIVLSNIKVVVSGTAPDVEGSSVIYIHSQSGYRLAGFWGAVFENIEMTGNWNYGINIFADGGTWITGLTFTNIFVNVEEAVKIDGEGTGQLVSHVVFERVQQQSKQQGTSYFAELYHCSDIKFDNCVPWDRGQVNEPSYLVDNDTCLRIYFEDSGSWSGGMLQEYIGNAETGAPAYNAIFPEGPDRFIADLTDFIKQADFYEGSTYRPIQKEEITNLLIVGTYRFVLSSAMLKILSLNSVVSSQSGAFAFLTVKKYYASMRLEVSDLQMNIVAKCAFRTAETGTLVWNFYPDVRILTTAQYDALTDADKVSGRIMFANKRPAFVPAKGEVRGSDGAAFTPYMANNQTAINALTNSLSAANYHYNNKHLINTTSGREVFFYNGIWKDYDGVDMNVNRSGPFSSKPRADRIYVGFRFFCTDRQTTEGATDGIEIIHKGNDVWVDALGRVVQ